MKKLFIIFVLGLFACGKSSHTPEVTIGNQIWTTKNLDVSTFRNGDVIPEAKTKEEWEKANTEEKSVWCYYDNDPKNGKKYGKLYNGYAVIDKRGLAPEGWHIPFRDELDTLENFLGNEKEGTKMKSKSGWSNISNKNSNGTNSSGFNGLPGGYRDIDGEFYKEGVEGHWRAVYNNEYDETGVEKIPISYYLTSQEDDIDREGHGYKAGYSVRCIKDKINENKSEKIIVDNKASFEGNWIADANSQVRYDGNRVTDITITKNGANFLFVFNKNDLGLKTMGTIDQSNNISLYGGKWLIALDATNKDNLFLKGEIFHRVK